MINLDLHQIHYSTMNASNQHSSSSDHSPPPDVSGPARSLQASLAPPPPEHVNTSFAFLVHSQETIPNNLPPSVDNKPLARQRRRRTSPEDQAILEEEYLRDSKPDKNARKRIVERVALGEKEVQIWFQNRRQNCRRKARPLLPHEIMSHLEASRGRSVPESSSISLEHEEGCESPHHATSIIESTVPVSAFDTAAYSSPSSIPQHNEPTVKVSPTFHTESNASPLENGVGLGIMIPDHHSHTRVDPLPATQAHPNTLRPISTTRPLSVAELITPEPKTGKVPLQITDTITSSSAINSPPKPTLKRSRSHLRLSLTSNGAAKITTGEDSSPSPPRIQPHANSTQSIQHPIRRTFSASSLTGTLTSPRTADQPNFGLRRIPSGRSRDSRAWEFWCDNDARTELQKFADQERTGSAADAISLMRSSSRGPLTPNLNKANAAISRHASAKRVKMDSLVHPRPGFGRAQSSVARLQGTILPPLKMFEDKDVDGNEKKYPKVGTEGPVSANSDSDKENWEPDTQDPSEQRQRALQSRLSIANTAQPRPVLKESATFAGRSSSLRALLNSSNESDERPHRGHVLGPGSREGKTDKENLDPEQDPEIARFMGRVVRPKTSPTKYGGEDMDCIQGLLSLSQGAWR